LKLAKTGMRMIGLHIGQFPVPSNSLTLPPPPIFHAGQAVNQWT